MSYEVPTHFVQQYNSNVRLLSQQKGAKLSPLVRSEPIQGKKSFYDYIGPTAVARVSGRHADTKLVNTSHSRRCVTSFTYSWADLVDDEDKLRMIYDPTSPYAQNAALAFARNSDDLLIAAAFDTAYSGEDGLTAVTFPSTQVIAHANSGMTLSKLLTLREMAGEAEEEDEQWYIAFAPKDRTNLLNTTEVKNSDYNSVKALVNGQIDTFLGFKFVLTNRLLAGTTATTSFVGRRCLAFCASGLVLATAMELNTDIGPRRDKNNSTQILCKHDKGAARLEEVKVVEVQCAN